MNRYFTILFALLLAYLFFSLSSCAKKEPASTLFSDMFGTWKKTAYATDDNGSGIIIPSEIYPQPSNMVDVLVFKADTTGYEYTVVNNVSDTLRFTWYVFGDSLAIAYAAHLTNTYYVRNVSAVNLTLYANTNRGLAAYYYNK